MNLHDDLTTRWKPSDEQIAAAAAAFEDPTVESVYTGHFMVGKEYGIWTADVELVYATDIKVAHDRYDGARAARDAAALAGAKAGGERPGTIGYTWHRRSGDWAVFEEILSPAKLLELAAR
jgi:hypothetical protein